MVGWQQKPQLSLEVCLNKYDLAGLLDEAAMGEVDKRSFLKRCSALIKNAQLEDARCVL